MAVDLSSSFFELFALPQSFKVDLKQVDERYRELQRTVHPDRFVNATDQERRLSMQQATRINEGYRTLKDPLRRGRYLLELNGFDFDDEQRTTSDSAFLMEQMELREALAEVRGADDPLGRLAVIMDRIAADFNGLTGELQKSLDSAGDDAARAAADTLVKMQFFRRLSEEAQELEAALEDALD
jgi:molecular chaperone HscB